MYCDFTSCCPAPDMFIFVDCTLGVLVNPQLAHMLCRKQYSVTMHTVAWIINIRSNMCDKSHLILLQIF